MVRCSQDNSKSKWYT